MTQRADKIYRGTVLDFRAGTVGAGGGELPTVTYRIEVTETFKGEFPEKNIVELQMIGTIKQTQRVEGDVVAFTRQLGVPLLEIGKEYLLLTSLPGPVGLSAPIGLGQGSFLVFQQERQDMAVNEFGNLGLFDGPVRYDQLAAAIRDALASAP